MLILEKYRMLSERLSSAIRSPHHFVSQCMEKNVVGAFDYLDLVIGLADGEATSFAACFASSIDSYQEVVATALYIEGDFPIIVDNDGADVETMWSYRCNGYGVAGRHNDGTANAQ